MGALAHDADRTGTVDFGGGVAGRKMMCVGGKSVPLDAQWAFWVLHGGTYVPETLMAAVRQLDEEYARARKDPEFKQQLNYYLKQFVGRPTPLYFAERLTQLAGGAKIYLERRGPRRTPGRTKINTIGQAAADVADEKEAA